MDKMEIVELSPFSRKIAKVLSKAECEELHLYLVQNPGKGDVISGTGGIRKLRFAAKGKGKRGGARVIYFYHVIRATVYLLTCYAKNEQSDIDPAAKKKLRAIVTQIKKGVQL